MKVFITVLLITLAHQCFGQYNGFYYTFSSAFKNIDSVKAISIFCGDMNTLNTDGCDSLPYNIGVFKNLTGLYISESWIKTLPNSIYNLKKLKELSLSNLHYFNYKSELCKLKRFENLEYLSLWMASLKILPNCIAQLKSLRQIDISFNDFVNIESTFKTLKQLNNLESLDISGIDSLKVIPNNITELKRLNTIQLDFLPDNFDYATSFDRLSSLEIKSLSLTHNKLMSLPPSFAKLKHLTFIDLSENYFSDFPSELFELNQIKQIKFQWNHKSLNIANNNISMLENLETINLGGSLIKNGKEAIINLSVLPKLKEIDLFNTRLDTIPDEIKNFISLEKLIISENPKINFPELFKKLSSLQTLKYLDISGNKISTLPVEIGLLTTLELLVIGENSIETLPDELFYLTNLKILNIYGNKLSEKEILRIKENLPNCVIISEQVFRD